LSPRDIIRSGISRIPQTDKQSSRSRSIDAIPDDISSRAGFRDARFAGGIKRIPGIEIYPVYRAFQLKAPDRRTELRIRLAGRLSINLRGQRANKGQRATVHVSLLSKRRGDRAIPGFSPRHARARARVRSKNCAKPGGAPIHIVHTGLSQRYLTGLLPIGVEKTLR